MNIGEKIIKIRKEHNLTQEEMANELYLTRQAISKYERNISYPSLDVLKLIQEKYGVSINYLLDINSTNQNLTYKALGYKHYGFIIIYSIMFIFVLGVTIIFNLMVENDNSLFEIIFFNVILGLVLIKVMYLLFKCIFPLSRILLEYNDLGIKIKTLKGIKEIPYKDISSLEIKTHGNYNHGMMIIRTYSKNYTLYPLKDLNQIKTILDEVKVRSISN